MRVIKSIEVRKDLSIKEILNRTTIATATDENLNSFYVIFDLDKLTCNIAIKEAVTETLEIPGYIVLNKDVYIATSIVKTAYLKQQTAVKKLVLPPMALEGTGAMIMGFPELSEIEFLGDVSTKCMNTIRYRTKVNRLISHTLRGKNTIDHHFILTPEKIVCDIEHIHLEMEIEDYATVIETSATRRIEEDGGRYVDEFHNTITLKSGDNRPISIGDDISSIMFEQIVYNESTVFLAYLSASSKNASISVVYSQQKKIVIPSKLIIDGETFIVRRLDRLESESVEKVELPSPMYEIQEDAFQHSTNLKEIEFNCEILKWNPSIINNSYTKHITVIGTELLRDVMKNDCPNRRYRHSYKQKESINGTATVTAMTGDTEAVQSSAVRKAARPHQIPQVSNAQGLLCREDLEGILEVFNMLPTSIRDDKAGLIEKVQAHLASLNS